MQKKEIEILQRRNQKKRLKFYQSDRIIFSILCRMGHIKGAISIVKPETVLRWQQHLIKSFWTFDSKNRVGRPQVSSEYLGRSAASFRIPTTEGRTSI